MGINLTSLGVFCVFLAITLGITAWASRRTGTRKSFYVADGKITGIQNGFALAGDFMSAATLLGIAGIYFSVGFDGFIYNLLGIIGFPVLLFLMAERLRSLGRFTMTDVLTVRLRERPMRIFGGVANLAVLIFYMVSQIVAAGALAKLLLGLSFGWSALLVGTLMTLYVVFGGMVATTWVQIIKASLLIFAGFVLAVLVLAEFDFSLGLLMQTAIDAHPSGRGIMGPSATLSVGAAISLTLTLTFGPAGLPHIMMRFFTVPDAAQARRSAAVATALVSVFALMMIVIGYGTIAILSKDANYLSAPGQLVGGGNMATLHLAKALAGDAFLGFISAVAFATILAVVSGLTLAAAATVSHDLYASLLQKKQLSDAQEIRVSRLAAFTFAAVSIGLSVLFQNENITFLSVIAFSIAASATFPVLLLSLYWSPLTTEGALAGGLTGLISAIAALVLGPSIWVAVLGLEQPLFPYQYPTILSMPLAFIAAIGVSLVQRRRTVLS